jgi:TPR repeat protein
MKRNKFFLTIFVVFFISFFLNCAINAEVDNTNNENAEIQELSFEEAKFLAEKGNVALQYTVATIYLNGSGAIEQNNKEAFKWFKECAKSGNVDAQLMISRMYLDGTGVDINIKEGLKWLIKAAEQGKDANIHYIVGNMYMNQV